MKHGKAPTRRQKIRLEKLHLIPENWLIVKDNSREFVIVHRISGEVRKLTNT